MEMGGLMPDLPGPFLPLFDMDPYEPDESAAPPPQPGTRDLPFSIAQINTAAREMLEMSWPDIWVSGEISNYKAHPSGHHYFSLKDTRAQISAVMFRGQNVHLRFRPADGLLVLARGRITLYEARGAYQINVSWMEPLGAGSLQAAFEKLKEKLRAEGLFDAGAKQPIPPVPERIGVVTSPTGAALADILRVLQRRHAGVSVLIAPCRVQGPGAAQEIAAAIALLNERAARDPSGAVDVMIVGRGGGSLEDLWAFNEEAVARAIFASRIPIISAVGHEVDVTIADFVADLRAPTPSAAAEMVVRSHDELTTRVDTAVTRLTRLLRYTLLELRRRLADLAHSRALIRVPAAVGAARQRCDEAAMRLASRVVAILTQRRARLDLATEKLSPRSLRAELAARRQRLNDCGDRARRAATALIATLRERLATRTSVLASLSPVSVLERGYALVQEPATGRVVTDAATLAPGREVDVRLARGRFRSRVILIKNGIDKEDA